VYCKCLGERAKRSFWIILDHFGQNGRADTEKMRLTISSQDLSEALSTASSATPARPSMLVYSAVSMSATEGKVVVMGSDGELTVRVSVEANVEEPGVVLVLPKPLEAWLGTVSNKQITISDDGSGDLVVSAPKSSPYHFRVVAGSFPQPPKLSGQPVAVDFTHFLQGLGAVKPAVGRESRVIQLVSSGTQLRLNATDQYRVGQAIIPGAGFGEFSGVLPLSTLEQIGTETNEVVTDSAGRVIELRGPSVTYTARLLSVAFPAVDSVLANLPSSSVVLGVGDIRRALTRLGAVAGQDSLWCTL
jgi:DNA polymerase-3 subunit beta